MFKLLLLPLLLTTAFLNAADITGHWLYTQHLPDGRMREIALFLKPAAPFG